LTGKGFSIWSCPNRLGDCYTLNICPVVVVGGGIAGLTVARFKKQTFAFSTV